MKKMNTEQARFNMVEQQIRPTDVLDQRVLDAISSTPREEFVPEKYQNLAYADIEVPLAHEQCMLTPIAEAKILQVLNIQPGDSVLEVGTGNGYLTAVISKLASRVESVEYYEDISDIARANLQKQGITNVALEVGDAAAAWDKNAPYDVIAITGSMPVLPDSFKHALKIGGRLFAIVGDSPVMECRLITRVSEQEWSEESLMETDVCCLVNVIQPQRFVL